MSYVVNTGVCLKNNMLLKSSTCTTDLGHLQSKHEEPDTRLVLHAVHSQFHRVVVSSSDTDVLLLLVSHFQSMSASFDEVQHIKETAV